MSAERHLAVVYRKVHDAPAQLEQQLPWVTVGLVLRDGVGDGLFGE